MYNMTRIIMSGCNGAMGTTITKIVSEDAEAEIVAGIDIVDDGSKDYPVFSSIKDCDVEADAVIDFSTPKILDDLLAYCEEKKVPVVLCTTGYDEAQLAKIEEASKKTAVLKSANMSLGINTLMRLVQEAAKVLAAEGFDVEIVENKPLARMLYANVDIGGLIPPELYQSVAEVLAFVYHLKGKA